MMWTVQNSEVACRQLGYDPKGLKGTIGDICVSNEHVILICASFTGVEVGPLLGYPFYKTQKQIDNVICTGSEQQLSDCSYDFHVTSFYTTFRMECEYCENFPLIVA